MKKYLIALGMFVFFLLGSPSVSFATEPEQITIVGICQNKEIAEIAFKAAKEGDRETLEALGSLRACIAIPPQKAPLMQTVDKAKDFEGDEIELVVILAPDGSTQVYTIYFPMHDHPELRGKGA